MSNRKEPNPKFSVIISVYNKENYIADTISSVLKQTVQDFEIVVVNDGSTDKSEDRILSIEDDRITYFKQENAGASAARNRGIKEAKNDFLAFLDADDYWYPNYLEEIKNLIEKYPTEKIYAAALEVETDKDCYPSSYSIKNYQLDQEYVLNYFTSSYQTSILVSSSIVIKADALEETGLFNTHYQTGEDTDLWIRLGLHFPVVFLSKICVRYRYAKLSLSNTNKSLKTKPDFSVYEKFSKQKEGLKKFLDLNRFSMAIEAELQGDTKLKRKLINQIDLNSLNKKQSWLLKQPKSRLKFLYKMKELADGFGVKLTTFS